MSPDDDESPTNVRETLEDFENTPEFPDYSDVELRLLELFPSGWGKMAYYPKIQGRKIDFIVIDDYPEPLEPEKQRRFHQSKTAKQPAYLKHDPSKSHKRKR